MKYGVLGALALIWTFRGSSKKRLEDSGSESKRTQRIQVEIRLTKAVWLLCGYRQSGDANCFFTIVTNIVS